MLKAVIFDMDGVIVDSEPDHYDAETVIFRDLGITIPEKERKIFVGLSNKNMWELIKKRYRLAESVETLVDFSNKARLQYFLSLNKFNAIPGIDELLTDIKRNNIKMALASSSSPEIIDLILTKLNLKYYFGKIISGDEVKAGKPSPDIFIHAAGLLREKEQDCVVIEDSEHGVKAAKSAGMRCIGFQSSSPRRQDLSSADLIINDFRKENFETIKAIFLEV